jgi:methylated-DNA-protein-cysteine methyltransferase-like protein
MKQADDNASYRAQVYLIVQQVPRGQVTTYGQVGRLIPAPARVDPHQYDRICARWVGRAMRHAPKEVPWHRVINSRGRISLPAGSRAGAIQRLRLEAEGIIFNRDGAINLGRYQWQGPDSLWAKAHGLLSNSLVSDPAPVQLELLSEHSDDKSGSES